jgi:hypothetical protein
MVRSLPCGALSAWRFPMKLITNKLLKAIRLKCLDGCYAVLRENLNKIYTKLGDFLEDSGGYKV